MKVPKAVLPFIFGIVSASVTLITQADAQIVISIAPPSIPIYVQPVSPGPAFVWTPGYWGRGPSGYVWMRGAWVMPPSAGVLWTPGYWNLKLVPLSLSYYHDFFRGEAKDLLCAEL